MNSFAANPEWGGWVIVYFFIGGLAAGGYFIAVLIEWFGAAEDRPLAHIAYRWALPLIVVCGLLLIVDLFRPDRFWHMLFKSEVAKAALAAGFPLTSQGWALAARAISFKYWSPMSVGSWGLTVFGFCAAASFIPAVWPASRLARWLSTHWLRVIVQVVGCLSGFFIASYTGTLLAATNQPVWSDTIWLGSLFLVSAVSTSLAAMTVIAHWQKIGSPAARRRLAGSEPYALILELVVIGVFLLALGRNLQPAVISPHGVLLAVGVVLLGIMLPLTLHIAAAERFRWSVPVAALLVLFGGLCLRYVLVTWPNPRMGSDPTFAVRFGPEDRRARSGGAGADQGNYLSQDSIIPRSKLANDE